MSHLRRFGIFFNECLEIAWIKKIFPDTDFNLWRSSTIKDCRRLYRDYNIKPIIVRGDNTTLEFVKITMFLTNQKIPFDIIHLSDEYGTDDLSWYALEYLQTVYRNYITPRKLDEFPCKEKVKIFPLGPLYFRNKDEDEANTSWNKRPYLWSFAGRILFTSREQEIRPFLNHGPHKIHLFDKFMDSAKKDKPAYEALLKESKFIPILNGSNYETFRFYEALEFGAIPIYIRQKDDDLYFKFLKYYFPTLISANNPDDIFQLSEEQLELYRSDLLQSWECAKKSPFMDLTLLEEKQNHE